MLNLDFGVTWKIFLLVLYVWCWLLRFIRKRTI